MQIHFIWISNFKYFEDKSINLSAEYKFHIEINHTIFGIEANLHIEKNEDFIADFFEKPNVTNVTGIIGKNGAGKSTILEYIKAKLPEGLEAGFAGDLVIYSIEEQPGHLKNYITYPENWQLEITGLKDHFIVQPYSDSVLESRSMRSETKLGDADYIYYSYILDLKQEATDWKGLYNLSTTALIEETRRAALAEINENEKTNQSATDLEYLIGNELSKAVQFLISEYRHLLPFNRPDSLSMFIDPTDLEYFSYSTDPKYQDIKELLKKFDSKMLVDKMEENDERRGVDLFCQAVLLNFFLTERKYSSNIQSTHLLNIGDDETVRDFVLRFFNRLRTEEVRAFNEPESYTYKRYMELSDLAPRIINLFEGLVDQHFITVHSGQNPLGMRYDFALTVDADEIVDRFFNLYLKVKGFSPFLQFRWRGLSTGEQSFLSFMSRFVHLKRHQIGSDQLRKSLVILIDEGDAGFHPEWQKQFFKHSLDFLSSLFKDHQIHLIYTANAPFLTSDLTKPHVIFLNKTSRTETNILEKENNRLPTFGANIHQLFLDSFYVEGAIIGDFAKLKIDSIIRYLNDKRIKIPDEKIRKTIAQIGEPIIRIKLQVMWKEKFQETEEIAVLLARVAELKAAQKTHRKSKKK
ncbi:hypothetical protein KXQ82_04315 [Mucilaginibacter sp. HMF5004]|uniref:hypothetical protein n=1 Tax=Mucilaginibacter rivuli TaxID=2857527 RepID=UPI001C5F6AA6|nr:hypothetical protein [Mucilaginibacter rivuli]MBW4888921.1 hypothetical protein [Mucilaginibacter rivuli]